jgi:hypothetical protein
MALERRNPLPAGRYWIDVVGNNIFIMEGWLKAVGPFAHVENQNLTPQKGTPPDGAPVLPGPDAAGNFIPEIIWYLFTTSKPLPWISQALGFPNVATADVHTKADTASRPPPVKGPLDDIIANLPSGEGMGSLALLAVLAYLEFGSKK